MPPAAHPAAPTAHSVADPAIGVTTELDGVAPAFSAALLAELSGADADARTAYERVLAAPDVPPSLAARAALRLAALEARAGKRHLVLDLVARAAALAPTDIAVGERVAQLEADVDPVTGDGSAAGADLRGPRLGTALPGVEPQVADEFAAAERALAAVHRRRPQTYIESLSSSIRFEEAETEDVVARYRAVARHGGLAEVAADYRIGSLYHDLALRLVFELPAELDPPVADRVRGTLRSQAVAYLRRAVASYRTSLGGPPLPDAELWRLAAETDLRGARDVLGEAGGAP